MAIRWPYWPCSCISTASKQITQILIFNFNARYLHRPCPTSNPHLLSRMVNSSDSAWMRPSCPGTSGPCIVYVLPDPV